MKANKIMEYLEGYFPLSLQMDFDRCGLQIGNKQTEVNKVYIALNADNETLQHCIDEQCQMLITHHPFLLEELVNIDLENHQGKFIENVIKNNIVVYSLHTCLDRGKNHISMNDWLINQLPVENVQCYDRHEIGKKAILKEPMKAKDFVDYIKDVYHLSYVRCSNNEDKMIQSIAICGGSAADDLEVLAGEVDCFITGDSKYRHAKYAIDHDIFLIDANHHLEVIFEEELAKLLKELPLEVDVHHSLDYFKYK